MKEPRRKISLRLLPELLDAGQARAREEGVGLRQLIENSLRDRLSISTDSPARGSSRAA